MITVHSSFDAATICFWMQGNDVHEMVKASISSHSAAVRSESNGGGVSMPRDAMGSKPMRSTWSRSALVMAWGHVTCWA